VTVQALAVSTAPVQVEITNDVADVSTAMNSFVTAYNAVAVDLKTQEGNDSNGNPEPLFGSPTLSLMQSQLSTGLLGGAASGAISSVTQLGVTVNQDGTLTFSSTDMTAALNNHYTDVVGFLQNTGSFGATMTTVLDGLGNESPTGAISLAQAQNTAQAAVLNTDVSNEEALLATQKISLTSELNNANQILQSIPSQLSEVNEMYSAVTGYNSNG
jgi:flagellar hook-associated protein 2